MENGVIERTREETWYWKNFNPVFKVDLPSHFRSRLEIPLYFCKNLKGKLPSKVSLKGPSTEIDAWEVSVATTANTTSIFGEGWINFITAFSLEENDTLLFNYKNNSYFKVRVISGKTSCEKESSHFVTNMSPGIQQNDDRTMIMKESEDGMEGRKGDPIILPYERDDNAEFIESSGSPYTESQKRSVSEAFASPTSDSHKRSASEVFASLVNVRVGTDYMLTPSLSDRNNFAEQIENAKERAKRIQMVTENSFFVSLSRSHVSGSHMKLKIPIRWWEEVINCRKNQSINLCCKDGDQVTSNLCYCVFSEKHNTATISSGWKKFVVENALCENDSCVFNLAKPWKEPEVIFLEVTIIRVVEPEGSIPMGILLQNGS